MKNNDTKNFIWNCIGLSFNCFNSLFFLIVVKLINGLDIAGIFTYAFSLCCLFYVVSTYYNRAYQVSDFNNKFSFNDYYTCRIIMSVISLILILILSILSKFSLYKIIVILLIMIFRIIESISDCFYGYIQKNGELYKVGISQTLKAIIGLIIFIILDFVTKDIVFSIISLIIINSVLLIFYDYRNYKNLNGETIKFSTTNFNKIFKICFDVFTFSFLSIYLANCQKYIFTYFVSNEIQTIFGIIIMPATILSLAGSYLIMPFIVKLTNYFKNNMIKEYKKLSLTICAILIIIGLCAIIGCYFLGIPILNIIYNIELSEYKASLMIIIIASILFALSMVISNLLTIINENKVQLYIYIYLVQL